MIQDSAFAVIVRWEDGETEDLTTQLPQYLLGEIAAHIREIEDRKNGRLPK